MPVAPNPLLQANAITSTSRSATAQADKPLGDKGDGFGQVMASQGRDKAAGQDDKSAPAKPKDKPEAAAGGKKDPADKNAVADDGNKLPADDATQADTGLRDASLVAGQVTDAQPGAQLIQAQAEAVAPVLRPLRRRGRPSPKNPLPKKPSTPMPTRWPTCPPCAWRWSIALRPRVVPRHTPRIRPGPRARVGRQPSIPWRIWWTIPRMKRVSRVTRPLVPCLKMA